MRLGVRIPRAADAGTIRSDFSMNVPSNLIHASDTAENAAVEVKRFFKDEEVFQYEKITDMNPAAVSMDGMAKTEGDRQEFELASLPLPITR